MSATLCFLVRRLPATTSASLITLLPATTHPSPSLHSPTAHVSHPSSPSITAPLLFNPRRCSPSTRTRCPVYPRSATLLSPSFPLTPIDTPARTSASLHSAPPLLHPSALPLSLPQRRSPVSPTSRCALAGTQPIRVFCDAARRRRRSSWRTPGPGPGPGPTSVPIPNPGTIPDSDPVHVPDSDPTLVPVLSPTSPPHLAPPAPPLSLSPSLLHPSGSCPLRHPASLHPSHSSFTSSTVPGTTQSSLNHSGDSPSPSSSCRALPCVAALPSCTSID